MTLLMSDSLKDIIDKSSLLDDESEIRENEVRISGELLLDSEYAISINIIELDMCVGSIVFVSNGLVIKKLLFAKNIDIENICNENIDNT